MKASEYIKLIQALVEENGDLEVETVFSDMQRMEAPPPEIAYKKNLIGRERKPVFWQEWEEEAKKGEPVIRI